jgi:TM2 domain-containing membrane protein YozV
MSADQDQSGQPEPGPTDPTSPLPPPRRQPSPWPRPPPWPQQRTEPQTWPRPPTGPHRPGPYGQGAAGQERYAVRPPAGELYGQQYGYDQRPLEWAPLPMRDHDYGMQRMAVAPKNPAVSVLLSVFIPGLGSMVNDNAGVGVAILILNIVGLVLSLVLIGIPLAIGTWIWGLVDAYRSAQRWNHAHGIIS